MAAMSRKASNQPPGGPGEPAWGRRLADEAAEAGGDRHRVAKLLRNAVTLVTGRLGEIRRHGIQPVLHDIAAQVTPASIDQLHIRYPGVSDDEVARRLTDRAAKTATAVALSMSGVVVAQEVATAFSIAIPGAAGGTISVIGVTALAEVVVLFLLEAKLRADLNALAGLPQTSPRELVASIVGEVQSAGGITQLRSRGLRKMLPEAAARKTVQRITPYVPARFARIVIPEVIAPVIGGVIAARLASRQIRAAGRNHWLELRGPEPTTEVRWGPSAPPPRPGPGDGNGHRPPASAS
jgi:hypothetical protein